MKANRIRDTFDGSAIDTTKWSTFITGGGSVTQGSGVVSCAVPASTLGAESQLISISGKPIDLQSSSISAKMTPHGGTTIDTAFKVWDETFSFAHYFAFGNGGISARYTVSGADTTITSGAYDATNHAYMRLRESGGTVYYETSPDGERWSVYATTTPTFSLDRCNFLFAAVEWAADASPGVAATIDNINIGQSPILPLNNKRPRPFAPGRAR